MQKAVIAALVAGLGLSTAHGAPRQQPKPPAASPRLIAVTLERAPGDLGRTESTGSLVLVTAAKGREVLLFDSASGELKPYLESGQSWAKPIRLRGRGGDRFSPSAFRLAVNGELVACAQPRGVTLFKLETGELVAEAPYLNHAASVAALPDGSWAVSLIRLPFPEIEQADKEKFGGPAPQFVVVNDKLEIERQGFAADAHRTPNQAAARALRFAASPNRLFAAEIANYKVYELDSRLKVHSTFIDPRLKLEEGLGLAADKQEQERFLSEARQKIAGRGTDATKRTTDSGDPIKGKSTFFGYQTVISDMAWDPFSHRLILLLADGVTAEPGALDLLDPATGQVQRLLLRFPEGTTRGPLSQLAVGHRFLWLRNHLGSSPTFRLDRSALEQARSVSGVERSELAAKE